MNLTQFLSPSEPPPPPQSVGRKGVWLDRLQECIEQVPDQWINATRAWGCKPTSAASIKKAARKAEVQCETRRWGDDLHILVR